MTDRTGELIDRIEAIAKPARWVMVAITTALLIWIAVAGAWGYALVGAGLLVSIAVKIRRQDHPRGSGARR